MKRLPVKYIRDRCKSAYEKDSSCAICGTSELLELHHYNSLTALFEKWCKKKGYSEDNVLEFRDEFINEHHSEIYLEVVTLCKEDHALLHKLYGLKPALGTAKKQAAWVEKRREKHAAMAKN